VITSCDTPTFSATAAGVRPASTRMARIRSGVRPAAGVPQRKSEPPRADS
jgi:hypothetical protein